jgi:hypothetical protein
MPTYHNATFCDNPNDMYSHLSIAGKEKHTYSAATESVGNIAMLLILVL